jgi:hypothetical protein
MLICLGQWVDLALLVSKVMLEKLDHLVGLELLELLEHQVLKDLKVHQVMQE